MKHPELWVPRRLGARLSGTGTRFVVFTTEAERVEVQLFQAPDKPSERRALEPSAEGTFELDAPDIGPGALYQFALDGVLRPDPYARFLPFGVHGPAEVVDVKYEFRHAPPAPRSQRVLYELHVGTFTRQGTYRSAEERLPDLVDLGVTTIELMPISAFPGRWGWGYDGVAGFAPFAPYGRPEELQHFIDSAHGLGLEVLLDVVYNHFGPDGNYLNAYSTRYFDPDIATPWGQAPRLNDPAMRSYVIENALYWLGEFRFDGLRFDACHEIHDASPLHIFAELSEHARLARPETFFVAEDDRNDPRELERMGADAVWADDFHHVLHVLLTGESDGYYAAYAPTLEQVARTITRGFFFEGQDFLGRGPRGAPADRLRPEAFVYCLQNHDQVGNRPLGSRLHAASELDAVRAASALLLFLPMTPLLFMGQEWAASSPFCYFTDHAQELGKAVSAGRRREFAHFEGFGGSIEIPDPQDESTYRKSQLDWDERHQPVHAAMLELYRSLLELRRNDAVLSAPGERSDLHVEVVDDVLVVRRRSGGESRVLCFNWGAPRPARDFAGTDELLLATAPLADELLPSKSAAIFKTKSEEPK